jgi:hypothetical protein
MTTRTQVQEFAPPTRSAGHMNAAVLYGAEDLKIERVDIPEVGADDILVRVKVALTCGTDLKVWKQGSHARMIKPPAVFRARAGGNRRAQGLGGERPGAHRDAGGAVEFGALQRVHFLPQGPSQSLLRFDVQ